MEGRWTLLVSSAASLLLLVATGPVDSETSTCRVQDCPHFRTIRYYEEIGCVRSDNSSECCPTRFNCSSILSLDKTKCHYDGKAYELGTQFLSGFWSPCIESCTCLNATEGHWIGEATFECWEADCSRSPLPEGWPSTCYKTYAHDGCCDVGLNCANDTKSPRNVTECTYKGQTFLEGQVIRGPEWDCMDCICQEGFDGTLREPWCRRHRCDYTIGQTVSDILRCAPVFNQFYKCCARLGTHCPSHEDIVVRHSENSTTTEGSETSTCRLQDCPHFRTIRYYEDIGCIRSDGSSECCPTRFNCSSVLSLDKTKCHYDGKTYELGTQLSGGLKSPCLGPCACENVTEGPWIGEAKFKCWEADCSRSPLPEEWPSTCYKIYRHDRCCSVGVNCANDTKSPRNFTECTFKGETYLEGQVIRGTESECVDCICQEGFDGTLREPWCRRHRCDYTVGRTLSELLGCAPVFNRVYSCCAVLGTHCPSDEDIVVRHSDNSTTNEGEQCTFGPHRLNIGDELLSLGRDCVKCTCDISPFITCEVLPLNRCQSTKK